MWWPPIDLEVGVSNSSLRRLGKLMRIPLLQHLPKKQFACTCVSLASCMLHGRKRYTHMTGTQLSLLLETRNFVYNSDVPNHMRFCSESSPDVDCNIVALRTPQFVSLYVEDADVAFSNYSNSADQSAWAFRQWSNGHVP